MATLLYVDDEEVIGIVVSRFFAMRGDVVIVAKDATSARTAIERENPAVIFLDVWLGAESGVDLMNWIVEHHPHLAERVTFVTGEHPGAEGPAPRWAAFGRPVIRKPFDLLTLAAALDAAESRAGT
jgi:DNA-binding NtrC family response regulator